MSLIYSRIWTGLPLIVGLVPIAVIALAYGLNVSAGSVAACVPFLDGCVSISGSGRMMPGILVFKGVLLPVAALQIVFWWIAVEWQKATGVARNSRKLILVLGIAGAISLIVYITFLGTHEPFYQFMRRFGIYGYFLGTLLAQCLATVALAASRTRTVMLFLATAPLLLGLLNLSLKLLLVNPDEIENQIEWFAVLLMQIWYLGMFLEWRHTGVTVDVRTGPPNAGS